MKKIYQDLLTLTQEIELALRHKDYGETLRGSLAQRSELFGLLQEATSYKTDDQNVIRKILECETRCITLAKRSKSLLQKEMLDTQRTKRCHTAYYKQLAAGES